MTIYEIFRHFGITKKYNGHNQAILAVTLVLKHEEQDGYVIKDIYKEVAKEKNGTWFSVDRNIRTLSNKAWRTNKMLLMELAGYELLAPPSSGDFVEMIASHIQRTEEEKAKTK